MNATIAKRFTFDAAHHLPMLPDGHKCRRLHGHTYEVELVLYGPVINGFVVDYADIEVAWRPIFDAIDHRTLNDVPGLEIPTTENLVNWMFTRFIEDRRPCTGLFRDYLDRIRIKESTTTWCEMSIQNWREGATWWPSRSPQAVGTVAT